MLDHAAISGQALPGNYSQTLISGDYYFVLSLAGPESEVNLKLGHDTIAKIEELLAQTPDVSPQELLEILAAQFTNSIKLHLLAAKITDGRLSLTSAGQVFAKLFRQGKIIDLSGKNISGPLRQNDLLVLSTAELPASFDPNPSVTEIRDSLLPEIESQKLPGLTALFIRATPSGHPEVSEETSETPPAPPHQDPPRAFLHRPSFPIPSFKENGSKKILYLSLVAFVTLISLVAFQLRSRALESRVNSLNQLKKQVAVGLSSAQKLQGFNDPLARDMLLQAKSDFETKAAADFGSDWQTDPALKSLDDSIDAQIAAVSHIYSVSKLDVYYDFSLLKANASIVSAELHKGEIVALDQTNGSLYSLSLANKGTAIITGGSDFKTSQTIDFSGDNIYALTSVGIYQTNRSESPAANKLIIKPSDKLGSIKGLKTFGGNLYLLDPQNNMIWKYLATDSGFADLSNYLKTGLSLDLSNVQSFAIDGYVYILSKSGSLVRFSQGSPDDFQISGLPAVALAKAGLDNSSAIYSSDETQNIYVLDSNNSRVVVFDKKGVYQAQYVFTPRSLGEVGLVLLVSEPTKKVFLVSQNLVYSFDLR